jgi:ATP-dependent RNA helicase DeaD
MNDGIEKPDSTETGFEEHLIEPDHAIKPIEFSDLSESMQSAAARAGWSKLMPVQARSIPYFLEKRDLMVQSRTGSGKTGAFMLPIIDRIDRSKATCQAMILVPTRELAKQVADEAAMLAGDSGINTIAVYGGVGYGPQLRAFEKGAHIVIGTPGRLLDHLERKSLSLEKLDTLVFDEADRMLSMGFYPDMREIRTYLPRRPMTGYMFSATFPPNVIRLAGQFLTKPDMLSLSRDVVHVPTTEQLYCLCPGMEKDRILARLIEMDNPASAIVFCNTKAQVEFIASVLQRLGYDADLLTADLSQSKRERVIERVRNGSLRFLIATDLAARGIDIPELSHVIQFEPPEDPESYIHRAGRTGRAGASGTAVTLVSSRELPDLKRIGMRFKIELIEREPPTTEDVEAIVTERTEALLEGEWRRRRDAEGEQIALFDPLAKLLAAEKEETRSIALLLDDFYQRSLHARDSGPGKSQLIADGQKATAPERALAALDSELHQRVGLDMERLERFLPLAKSISGRTEDSSLIAMLLHDFYFASMRPKKVKQDRPEPKKQTPRSSRSPRAPRSSGRSGPRKRTKR